LLASGSDDADSANPTVHWIKVLIGVLFLVTALPQWRTRPRAGVGPEIPKWMAAIARTDHQPHPTRGEGVVAGDARSVDR
jgi:hypothetical protein